MTEPQLRNALQRCTSRLRRSAVAMEAFQERAVRDWPIHEATELLDASEHIRELLSGEEGQR
jgi:hypothetical protein